MRVLITGGHGLLGQKTALVFGQETEADILVTDLAEQSWFTRNSRFTYRRMDLTKRDEVKRTVLDFHPDAIINTAAMTDVDACEVEKETCWRINVDGVKNLCIPMRSLGDCHLVHLSTDYVFDGTETAYDERMRTEPISYYGKAKLAAENALIASGLSTTIVRTQVLYGAGIDVKRHFVNWVIDSLQAGKTMQVVTDQIGHPTLVDELGFALVLIAQRRAPGLYHVCGSEAASRYDFALKIAEVFGGDPSLIRPCTSDLLQQVARRPRNSTFITLMFETDFRYRLSAIVPGLLQYRLQLREGASLLEGEMPFSPSHPLL